MFSLFDEKTDENLLQKYLMVDISNVFYAFKIAYIQEIIPMIEIFTIDTLHNNVIGLINLRGETIPVYNLNQFLGKEHSPIDETNKLLVLKTDDKKIAIIINNVGEIVQIVEDKITSLVYEQSISFLSTTIIDQNTILIVNVADFIDCAATNLVEHKNSIADLLPTGTAIAKIKSRTSLINDSVGYDIAPETFLNEKFIILKLNEENYAFNISYIKEIKKLKTSTINKVPCVPEFIKGVLNFRGDYISIVDMKVFLNIPSTPLKDKMDIVILKIDKLKVGIIIDEIVDITSLQISKINPNANSNESYIIGELMHNDELINMLNIEKLFSLENINIENYE